MMIKANRGWLIAAVLLSLALLAGTVPYLRWAIFVVSEPISNPLWPNKHAMFWDGIGFGLLFLIVKLWWCAIPVMSFLLIAWMKAFQKPRETGANKNLEHISNSADAV